ncbi:hypothetical protein CTI12_AA049010 [Artemisia annua]|uniref:DUF674 family protein n=1 Tax=Artemisia annua TaxID=35608 RepID=A0A2U1PGN0_ARTAN|nr:hypothetical protein CTI12_AA049010 [Artemisia annua]
MAETMANEPKISIKVIVDKEKNRVLYAEADYTFVDILFSFMTLPMGAIVRLLGEQADKKFEALGSLNNLYYSLVDLPECYFITEECRLMLLNPRSPSYDRSTELKLKTDDTAPTKYFVCKDYTCTFSLFKFSTCNTSRCSKCGKFMDQEIHFKNITHSADADCVGCGVFVSDITTFIVTDDLRVMPHTPGCCIQSLIDLGVTDTSHLEERTVELGREQILNLLRLSLQFSSPLTHLVGLKTPPSQVLESCEQGKFDQYTSLKKEDSESSKMVLQVSLQKSTGKLLFAEAEEDFVDFVFGFLAISIGTAVGTLMNGNSPLLCMDNIYRSISDMSIETCLKSQDVKDILLKPHFGQPYSSKNQIFPINGTIFPKMGLSFYESDDNCYRMWYDNYIFTYKDDIDRGYTFNDPRIGGEFFKRSKMFMVTDDLLITSSLSISTMDILIKWKVPLKDIERHTVTIGLEEGLKMLKASLKSKSTLTKGLENQLKNLNQTVDVGS